MKLLSYRHTLSVHHTTMHQFTVLLHAKPHSLYATACIFFFSFFLSFFFLLLLLLTATCTFGTETRIFCVLLRSHGGGTDTEIRTSTESRPWRRKFSRRSCRDSNPRPFSHESCALTTELSPLPHKSSLHIYISSPPLAIHHLRTPPPTHPPTPKKNTKKTQQQQQQQ